MSVGAVRLHKMTGEDVSKCDIWWSHKRTDFWDRVCNNKDKALLEISKARREHPTPQPLNPMKMSPRQYPDLYTGVTAKYRKCMNGKGTPVEIISIIEIFARRYFPIQASKFISCLWDEKLHRSDLSTMLRVEGTIFMNTAAYEVFGKRPFDTNRDFDPPKIHSLPDEDFTIVDVNPNGKDIKKVLAIELGEDGVPLVDIRSPTKIIGFGQNSLEASLEGLPSDLY